MKNVSAEVIHDELYSKCISQNDNHLSLYKEIGMKVKTSTIESSIVFPHLKQILFRDVTKVCKKYNLVIAPIERFTGQVPNKNLLDVAGFLRRYQMYGYKTWSLFNDDNESTIFMKDRNDAETAHKKIHWGKMKSDEVEPKYSLFICAPKDQLIIRDNEKIKGYKIVTDDPIILAVETFRKYRKEPSKDDVMIIVTAWGEEASDPDVINEKLN